MLGLLIYIIVVSSQLEINELALCELGSPGSVKVITGL